MLDVHAVGHLILLNIGLILQLELVIGNREVLADLVDVHKRIAHHAPFRHLVFGLVLLVGGADFRLVW